MALKTSAVTAARATFRLYILIWEYVNPPRPAGVEGLSATGARRGRAEGLRVDAGQYFTFDFHRNWLVPSPTGDFCALFYASLIVFAVAAERVTRRAAPRWRVAVALASAVGALTAVELELRVVAMAVPHMLYSNVPGVYWSLQPNTRGYAPPLDLAAVLPRLVPQSKGTTQTATAFESNSLGLRNAEVPFDKPADEYRIVCLGDSWTFGQGVGQDETFARVLEKRLANAAPDVHVRVINAGMPGASFLQGYLLLSRVALRYHPDLVLVCGFNPQDSLPALDDLDPDQSPLRAWLRGSMIYSVLRAQLGALAPASSRPGVSSLDYARRMSDLLARHGIAGLFFGHVVRGGRHDPVEWERVEAPDLLVSAPNQRMYVLHPNSFRGNSPPFMQEADPFHPSPMGHAEIARVLADCLREWGIVRR